MELKYIKVNGRYYYPQRAGVQNPRKVEGCYYSVCIIKKLLFGRWRIDYYDYDAHRRTDVLINYGDENKPNTRLIVYPSGVEEIKWVHRDIVGVDRRSRIE